MLYFKNFVLTSEGYKLTSDLTPKHFTYNRQGRHSRVIYTSDSKVSPTSFTLLSTQVDNVPILIRNDKKVFTVDLETFDKKYKLVEDITEDHWLFTPWVVKDKSTAPRKNIDLTQYVDNHSDPYHLYLFNNEILEIATKLDIPFRAVKELLIREAAEYDEHLDRLRAYITEKYNITEDLNEPETSFINFKKYVLKNHIFKMNRYIEIDMYLINFLIASLTRATFSQNTYNKNNRYQITFDFEEDSHIQQYVVQFLKNTKVKYELDTDKRQIRVLNKPLYKLVTDGFLKDLSFVFRLEEPLYNLFVSTLFKGVANIKLDLELLLQIKQAFLYHRKVVAIKDLPEGSYKAQLIESDSLNSLDETVIFEDDGYYAKVLDVSKVSLRGNYTHVSTDDSETLYLSCVVKD